MPLLLNCSNPEQAAVESEPQAALYHQDLVQLRVLDEDYPPDAGLEKSRQTAITRSVHQNRDAIVRIIRHPEHKYQSGFFICEDGHVVTIMEEKPQQKNTWRLETRNGQSMAAELIGYDPYSGIALLKTNPGRPRSYVRFADSDSLTAGEWGIALGTPFSGSSENRSPTVSAGVISSREYYLAAKDDFERAYHDLIRTDAAVMLMSAGGPLLNADGHAVGVTVPVSGLPPDCAQNGCGFAVPGNKVVRLVNYLASGLEVSLDYSVGLEMVPVTEDLSRHYRLPVSQGLLVLGVNRDGPAYEGGVLPGDVITRIGNELIYGEHHAWSVLRQYSVGEIMPLTLWRGDRQTQTRIVLRQRMQEDFPD